LAEVAAQNKAAEHNYCGPHDRLRCLEHDELMTLEEHQLLAESFGCQCSTSEKFVLTAVYMTAWSYRTILALQCRRVYFPAVLHNLSTAGEDEIFQRLKFW